MEVKCPFVKFATHGSKFTFKSGVYILRDVSIHLPKKSISEELIKFGFHSLFKFGLYSTNKEQM